MKYLKKYEIFESENNNSELIRELDKYNIENYTINEDGTIDVNSDVDLSDKKLTKIPFRFGKVTGYFNCYKNKLTSLEGCPKEVGGFFSCSENNLTDLIGGPQEVVGNYYCWDNQLESLEGCAGDIGGYLLCSNNKLTSLDCSSVVVGNINCKGNGFKEEPDFFGICGGKIFWEL